MGDTKDVRNGLYMGGPDLGGTARRFGGDGDVIHVDADERAESFVFGNSSAVSVVHKGLESGGRIAEAEHHDSWLVEAAACFKRRFMGIGLFEAYIVVTLSDVELGI